MPHAHVPLAGVYKALGHTAIHHYNYNTLQSTNWESLLPGSSSGGAQAGSARPCQLRKSLRRRWHAGYAVSCTHPTRAAGCVLRARPLPLYHCCCVVDTFHHPDMDRPPVNRSVPHTKS